MNFKFYLTTTSKETKKHNRPYYVAVFLRGKLRRTSIKIKKYPNASKRFWFSRSQIETSDFSKTSPEYYKVICDSFAGLLNACANPEKTKGLSFRPLSITKRKLKWKRAYKKLLKNIPVCILNEPRVREAYDSLVKRILDNEKFKCLTKNKTAEQTEKKLEKVGKKLSKLTKNNFKKLNMHNATISSLESSEKEIKISDISYSIGKPVEKTVDKTADKTDDESVEL